MRRFGRQSRLLRREQFRYVARNGRRVRQGCFVMLVAMREPQGHGGGARLGITVSHRVGTAVARNRLKRIVREWFRHQQPRMRQNLDIVVIPQRPAAASSRAQLMAALGEAARAGRLLA